MRFKFILFGHEIRIRPEYDVRLHVSDFEREDIVKETWEHDFNISKRINAMTRHHGFISYIFRDFDVAIISFRESAIILLEDVMKSLRRIRENLALAGATDEDLNKYDMKIHDCFQKTLNVIRERIKNPQNYQVEADKELLTTLEKFKIYEYRKE